MASTVIKNGRVISGRQLIRANILVQDEKIEAVGKREFSSCEQIIDAKGCVILPGLVDGHAHLHDPAFTKREDFTTGTNAAAAGGVTTVVEMVLSTPVDSPVRVNAKIAEGKRNSIVDFALHAGMMNRENLANIEGISKIGVRSFKTFTCKPYLVDDHTLMSLLRETAMRSSILNVHAEDEEVAQHNLQALKATGRKDPSAHSEWKPNIAEEKAVRKMVNMAASTQGRLHISHLSTAEGVDLVKKAKKRQVRVTVETCPHYLTFTRRDLKKQGPYLKMNPSLKGPQDALALWNGLRNGAVDIVTSEHAPSERWEKEVGWSDIWKAWGGVPTIETMLPVLLSEGVNKSRMSIAGLQRVCCENPARIFGLYSRKGAIRKGADADLVIVDLKMKKRVRAEHLHYKCGWTPYEGRVLKGWPVLTMLRGEIVFEEGEVVGKPGIAEFLPMLV